MKSSPQSDSKEQKIYANKLKNISNKYDTSLIKISEKTFPKMFLTKKLSNNNPLVLKVYQFQEKHLFESFFTELQQTLQSTLKIYHEIIDYIALKDCDPYELYLFSERAEFSLNELISSISENIPKPELELLQIYSDLAYNLQYAHQNNFTHGNIHPNNILVFCNCRERPPELQNFNVFTTNIYKIGDWKFDSILQIQNKTENFNEMFPKNSTFRAPEFFNCVRKSDLNFKACDVYSLAMSILNCCGIPVKRLLPISISEQEIHDIQLQKIFQELGKIYDYKFVEILKMSLVFDISKRWVIENVVFALKNLSKSSTMTNEINLNEQPEKKPKKGILKKLFSGIFKGKKSKNAVSKNNENNYFSTNNENIYEYALNTKLFSLQVFCREDYSSVFNHKQNKSSK